MGSKRARCCTNMPGPRTQRVGASARSLARCGWTRVASPRRVTVATAVAHLQPASAGVRVCAAKPSIPISHDSDSRRDRPLPDRPLPRQLISWLTCSSRSSLSDDFDTWRCPPAAGVAGALALSRRARRLISRGAREHSEASLRAVTSGTPDDTLNAEHSAFNKASTVSNWAMGQPLGFSGRGPPSQPERAHWHTTHSVACFSSFLSRPRAIMRTQTKVMIAPPGAGDQNDGSRRCGSHCSAVLTTAKRDSTLQSIPTLVVLHAAKSQL